MKNRQGIVWAPILIIVATVVVAGVATYFLIQNNNGDDPENTNVAVVNQTTNNATDNLNTNIATNTNQVANNNASVNTNTTANTNTVSNTNTSPAVAYKTYTSTLAGFSLQYPSDWSITGFEGLKPVLSANSDTISFTKTQNQNKYVCVNVKIGSGASDYALTNAEVISTLSSGINLYRQRSTSVGKEYVRLTLGKEERSVFLAPKGQKVWALGLFNCNQGDLENLSLSYDEQIQDPLYTETVGILKSLKFTE